MRTRRGGIIIFVALALLVILGFAALVIDLGYARIVHAQLQVAADAGALAGASRLDQSAAGLTAARATAVAVTGANVANGEAVVVDANSANDPAGDVVLGTWDGANFAASTDAAVVNAVLVRTEATGLVALFSSPAFGTDSLAAATTSVARMGTSVGAGEVPYYLPFGLPSCYFDDGSGDLRDITFELNPAGEDNTGWALVGEHPDVASLLDLLTAMLPCMQEWAATGEVSEDCATADTSDSLGLDNGEMTNVLKALINAMVNDGIDWDTSRWGTLPPRHSGSDVPAGSYGQVLEGPLPVFQGDEAYCSGEGGWVQSEDLVGFVWGVIYDVRWKGAASKKNVWVRIDPDGPYSIGSWYGGGGWGVEALGPAVVVR